MNTDHDLGLHDTDLVSGCLPCSVDADELGIQIPEPTCTAWYASSQPNAIAVRRDLIDTECGKPATKVAYRQGQPIYRCDQHAVGIQATYFPINFDDAHEIGPVGGHSNRQWCSVHKAYANEPWNGTTCNDR